MARGCSPLLNALGEPRLLIRSVKSSTGLLLTRVTELDRIGKKKGVIAMGRISMPQGKGSQMHNRRDYGLGEMPKNIDWFRLDENIYLIDKDIREAYQEYFGEALKNYNAKQKRSDRLIDDYYEHIKKSKNGEKLFYEDVLQWGSKEDFEAHPELRDTAKKCLIEYVEGFEDRNPNLKLIGAYIHMDEASPHLHLDYVPVAHGYSRGMATRNSLNRAMREMGFEPEKETKKNNPTKLWKEAERDVFRVICESRGLLVEKERKARGSFSPEEYKELKDKIVGDLEEKVKNAKSARDHYVNEAYSSSKLNDEMKDSNKRLAKSNEDLKRQNNSLKEALDSNLSKLDQQEQDIKKLNKEKVSLKEDIENLEIEYDWLKKQPPKEKIVEVEKVVEVKKDYEEEYKYVHRLLTKFSSFIQAHKKLEDLLFAAIPDVMEDMYAITTPRSRGGRGR